MVRWMIRRDLNSPVFNGKANKLLPKLRQVHTIGLVHEIDDDEIDGYMLYTMYKKRNLAFVNKLVGNEQAIINFVAKLRQRLPHSHINNIYIRVDGHKLVLQLLLKKLGFICTKYDSKNEKMTFVSCITS